MARKPSSTRGPARIDPRILQLRDVKVMIDSDLAAMYGVPTRRLNEQVRRNRRRFPPDFMIQLTREETAALRSPDAISKPGRGGRRYAPLAFTEQGVAMLSSVLRSERAVQVNIEIMRAFVRLRVLAFSHHDLASKLRALELKYEDHDARIREVFDAIRALMEPPDQPRDAKPPIGFRPSERPE